MKLTYRLLKTQIHPALLSLSQKELDNLDAVLKIVKNLKIVNEILKDFSEVSQKIISNKCLKDKEGHPKLNGIKYQFESAEIKESVQKKVDELLDKTVELDLEKITTSDLDGVKVSPSIILALDKLFKE